MMSNAHGLGAYAHMNNGQFEPCTLDDGGSVQIRYIINCWNNRRTALTRYLQGRNHRCGPSWYCVKIYPSPRPRSVQQVEDDDAFCRAYLSVYG